MGLSRSEFSSLLSKSHLFYGIIAASVATLSPFEAFAQFTVTGKVSSVSSQSESAPLSGALVRVLGDSGTVSDTTAADGSFRITAPTIEGRWGVIVTKTGYLRFAKEFKPAEIGEDGGVVELDVILKLDTIAANRAANLKSVTVAARRYPPRQNPRTRDGESRLTGSFDLLSQMIAGTVPTPDGSSISEEGKNTIDGLEMFGALPKTFAGFIGTPSNLDPASSGGNTVAYETRDESRDLQFSLSNPRFLFAKNGARFGNELSSQALAYRDLGNIGKRKGWQYLLHGELSQEIAPQSSLHNYNADILERYNIPQDSMLRLMSVLNTAGVVIGGVPSRVIDRSGSALFRLERGKYTNPKFTSFLVGLMTFSNSGFMFQPAEAATHGAGYGRMTVDVGAGASRMIGGQYLHDIKFSGSVVRSKYQPETLASEGIIGLLPTSLTSALIGGSSMSKSGNTGWRLLATNQLTMKRGDVHRFAFGADAIMEGYSVDAISSSAGRYTFQTLAEFESLQPSSFYMRGGSKGASAQSYTIAAFIGDQWKVKPTVSASLGLRGEYTRLLSSPERNSDLLSAFSLRNDKVPNTLNIAPRVGVSWLHGVSRTAKWNGGLDMSYSVSSSRLGVQSVVPVMQSTGLDDGIRDISCVGSAIAPINFSDFNAGAAAKVAGCLDANAALVDALPAVRLFGSSFKPAQNHFSLISFNTQNSKAGKYRLALYNAYTYFGMGMRDANFNNVAQFSLSNEDDRPVFVGDASIVTETGRISASGARANDNFGRVLVSESDLKSRRTQLMVLGERRITQGHSLIASYRLTNSRRQIGGINGTTDGDPSKIGWVDDPYPVHSIVAQMRSSPFRGMPRIGMITRVQLHSGFKFTPMVDADINGDGSANDRAYIFSPTGSGAADVRAEMDHLLLNSSRYITSCLRDQLGRIAKHNSCSTPWNMGLDLELSYYSPRDRDWPIRWTLKTQNLLAAIDRGLHGAMEAKGWGVPRMPDRNLLRVTGFNPTEQKFVYSVNPRFGDVSAGRSPNTAPFTVVLQAHITLGRSPNYQLGKRLFDRLTYAMVGEENRYANKTGILEKTIAKEFFSGFYENPVPLILKDADTLQFSIEQERDLEIIGRKVDDAIIEALKNIGDSVMVAYQKNKPADVVPLTKDVTNLIKDATRPLMQEIARVLSPLQIELLVKELRDRLKY